MRYFMVCLFVQNLSDFIHDFYLSFILFQIILSLFDQNFILSLQNFILSNQNTNFIIHFLPTLSHRLQLNLLYLANIFNLLQLLIKLAIIFIQKINLLPHIHIYLPLRDVILLIQLPLRRSKLSILFKFDLFVFVVIFQQNFIDKMGQYFNLFRKFTYYFIFIFQDFLQSHYLIFTFLLITNLTIFYYFLPFVSIPIFNDRRFFNDRKLINFILQILRLNQIMQFDQIFFIVQSQIIFLSVIIGQQQ